MGEPIRLDTSVQAAVQIHIDGPWELPEFSRFIQAVHTCYGLLLATHRYLEEREGFDDHFSLDLRVSGKLGAGRVKRNSPSLEHVIDGLLSEPTRSRKQPLPDERILLVAAQFASPGFCEFLGVSQLIVRLRDLCHVAADYEKRRREIELEHLAIDLERKKVTLIREKMELYRDALRMPLPLSEADKRALLQAIVPALKPIEDAAAYGLITSAERARRYR